MKGLVWNWQRWRAWMNDVGADVPDRGRDPHRISTQKYRSQRITVAEKTEQRASPRVFFDNSESKRRVPEPPKGHSIRLEAMPHFSRQYQDANTASASCRDCRRGCAPGESGCPRLASEAAVRPVTRSQAAGRWRGWSTGQLGLHINTFGIDGETGRSASGNGAVGAADAAGVVSAFIGVVAGAFSEME